MSVDSAFALPDLSTAANHAGAMTTAGALSNPAATKSRRVTGRLWFWCRIGSPRAWGRAGFLRMNMGSLLYSRYCRVTAALASTAVQAALVALETVAVLLKVGIRVSWALSSVRAALAAVVSTFVPIAFAISASITMLRLVVFGVAVPKNAAEVALMLTSSPVPKNASRSDCV